MFSFAAIVNPPYDIIPADRIADIHSEDIFSTTLYKPSWISPPAVTPITPVNTSIVLPICIRCPEPVKVTEAVLVLYTCHDATTSNLLADILPRSIFTTNYYTPSRTSSFTAPQSNAITTLLVRIGIRRTKVTEAVPVEYTCYDAATTLPDLSRAMRIIPDLLLPIVESEPCTYCTASSGLDAQTVCSGST